jgi:hypothetical protein
MHDAVDGIGSTTGVSAASAADDGGWGRTEDGASTDSVSGTLGMSEGTADAICAESADRGDGDNDCEESSCGDGATEETGGGTDRGGLKRDDCDVGDDIGVRGGADGDDIILMFGDDVGPSSGSDGEDKTEGGEALDECERGGGDVGGEGETLDESGHSSSVSRDDTLDKDECGGGE